MISGYFLSEQSFKTKSLSKLFTQVWFYSILLFAAYTLCSKSFSLKNFIFSVFPTLFGEYWFFTAYIVLFFLAPFFNILIKHITQLQFRMLLLVAVGIWIVIPTFTTCTMYGTQIPLFSTFYLIGAYYKKYPSELLSKKRFSVVFAAVSFALLFLSTIFLNILEGSVPALSSFRYHFYSQNSLLILGCAISLFSVAIYYPFFNNRFINLISGCTFGVYLIHDNRYMRAFIWKDLLGIADYYAAWFFPFYVLGCVIAVFLGCTIIEFIRQKTVAIPFATLVNKFFAYIADVILHFLKRDDEKISLHALDKPLKLCYNNLRVK